MARPDKTGFYGYVSAERAGRQNEQSDDQLKHDKHQSANLLKTQSVQSAPILMYQSTAFLYPP